MKKHLMAMMAFVSVFAAFPVKAIAEEAPIKDWTFLVFLNGHNNLDSFGSMNIKQMEEVGSNDKINIVVQWASMENKGTQRLLVQKSTDPNKVTSPIVEDMAPVDMGDVSELVKFVEWGAKNYPAKHYFVNVWNHGNGWHIINSYKLTGMKPTDISYDDRTGNHITTEQLGKAMADVAKTIGHKVDIYGSDACLMAMAEVAGEMVDSVDYFVGSEEVEPGQGWPYSTFLKKWTAMKDSSPREVAKLLSRDYLEAYSGGIYGSQPVTMSAMDLSQLGTFNQAVGKLSGELMKASTQQMAKALSVAKSSQKFTNGDYKDLGDFLGKMGKQNLATSQIEAIRGVKTELDKLVISNNSSPSFNASGVAIWLPTSTWEHDSYKERYRGLAFAKSTGWGEFLSLMIKK